MENNEQTFKEALDALRARVLQAIMSKIVAKRLEMVTLGILSFGEEGLVFSNPNARIKSLYFNGEFWQVYAQEVIDGDGIWLLLDDEVTVDDLIVIVEAIDGAESLENVITRPKV